MSDDPRRPSADKTFESSVLATLARFVSTPTAASILKLARRRTGVAEQELSPSLLARMLDSLGQSVEFFTADQGASRESRAALEKLLPGGASAPIARDELAPSRIAIRAESDINHARLEARRVAALLGFSQVGQTKLVTSVSELARNIVQYANEGTVEFRPTESPPSLEICASDRGPGIANLDEILSGNYRSKQGLSLGLRGVKQLAKRFDVATRPGQGTTITAVFVKS
jgi:serine/threonine-protein kinase RsbT